MLKKFLSLAGVCLVAALADASAQNVNLPQGANDGDGFRLERGRYFDASAPSRPARNKKRTSIERIETDFAEALEIVGKNHVDGNRLDANAATKSAIAGMLQTLDPHSKFYDSAQFEELKNNQHSEYFGIGTSIADYTINGETNTFVVAAAPRSPASGANLRFGDKILKVNGEDLRESTAAEISRRVRGKENTIVRLTLERAATGRIETVALRRARVVQPSIADAYLLRERTGYIDLSGGFNYTTSDELETALAAFQRQNVNAIILDLRNNPGGLVEQAVRVAERFLQPGQTILSQRGRNGFGQQFWQSSGETGLDLPLVVLVNNNTASASEIVAGALQDYRRALVVGETTFGKGLVQSVLALPNGAGLVLTTSRYYTPAGRSLQRDYSAGSFYDYYARRNQAANPKQIAAQASAAKTVGGIEPDEFVETPELTHAQIKFFNPIFAFARELVNGRIAGFENYRSPPPLGNVKRIQPDELTVDEKMFSALGEFIAANKNWNLNIVQIEKQQDFIRRQLRFYLVTAYYGSTVANQVLTDSDSQVARALSALPRAKNFAANSRRNVK